MVRDLWRHPPEQPEARPFTPAVGFASALPPQATCFGECRHDCGQQVENDDAKQNALHGDPVLGGAFRPWGSSGVSLLSRTPRGHPWQDRSDTRGRLLARLII
jgi:hypothetical protein